MLIKLFKDGYYEKICKERSYYNMYGKVFIISTKTIKRGLLIFDTIIPMTFFIPCIIGNIMYKILGDRELWRITKEEWLQYI